MKNHIIRVERTHSTTENSPEFATHNLSVKINFAEAIPAVKDLSIRIFTTDYDLIGSDTLSWNKGKKLQSCQFNVSSCYSWDIGSYLIFVYRNDVPLWWDNFFLHADSQGESVDKLHPFEDNAIECYFATNVCDKSWWETYKSMEMGNEFTQQFLLRLLLYQSNVVKGKWIRPAALFFTGDLYDGRKFSKAVLGEYLRDREDGRMCYTSLKRLMRLGHKWKDFLNDCKTCRVALVEVSDVDNKELALAQFRKLCDLIEKRLFPNITFIFFGLPCMMKNITGICRQYSSLSAPDNFFVSPSVIDFPLPLPDFPSDSEEGADHPEEEEDEFDRYLREFVTSKDSDLPTDSPFGKEKKLNHEEVEDINAEQQLHDLIGLRQMKEEFEDVKWTTLFFKEREACGLDTENGQRNHMLFLGNPGTGKTTVAKLIGKIYHDMGLLSIGHTVETNRSQLVGQFIGYTETKTREAIEEARGGVLFIDEAYTLFSGEDDTRDYGREVINTLLTVLSEPNPNLIVILAGYEDKMENMLKCNPGLRDRFPLKFHFEDYTADELMDIAHLVCQQRQFILTPAAEEQLKRVTLQALENKDPNFSNGRWVHNLLEHGVIKYMAKRVMSLSLHPRDRKTLSTIEAEDILEAEQKYLHENRLKILPKRVIGFTA